MLNSFCHERIAPWNFRKHEGGIATGFAALVYFPASDSRRASDLLWPTESSINDAVQVQKQASRSQGKCSPGTLRVAVAWANLRDERPRGRRVLPLGTCRSSARGRQGEREEMPIYPSESQERKITILGTKLWVFGISHHHFFPPRFPTLSNIAYILGLLSKFPKWKHWDVKSKHNRETNLGTQRIQPENVPTLYHRMEI